MEMILAVAVILLAALVVWLLVQRIMRAINIQPDDPDARAGGFQDVIDRFQEWADRRRDRE